MQNPVWAAFEPRVRSEPSPNSVQHAVLCRGCEAPVAQAAPTLSIRPLPPLHSSVNLSFSAPPPAAADAHITVTVKYDITRLARPNATR